MSAGKKRERHRKVPLLPEVRHFKATDLEVRSSARTDELILRGSPIVYDTPYTVIDAFGSYRETMRPGVAADALARQADVRFLFNHDGLPLARSTSGTLSVTDAGTELRFTACLDARQQLANDLYIAVERGDVSQMSVGFVVARDEWPDDQTRVIHSFAEFLDISAVTYPASTQTSVQVAQRMAMAVPVESRARVRRALQDVAAGKQLSREKLAALRAIVPEAEVPSGRPARAPRSGGGDLTSRERLHAELAARDVKAARSHPALLRARLRLAGADGGVQRALKARIEDAA